MRTLAQANETDAQFLQERVREMVDVGELKIMDKDRRPLDFQQFLRAGSDEMRYFNLENAPYSIGMQLKDDKENPRVILEAIGTDGKRIDSMALSLNGKVDAERNMEMLRSGFSAFGKKLESRVPASMDQTTKVVAIMWVAALAVGLAAVVTGKAWLYFGGVFGIVFSMYGYMMYKSFRGMRGY